MKLESILTVDYCNFFKGIKWEEKLGIDYLRLKKKKKESNKATWKKNKTDNINLIYLKETFQ